MLQVGSFAQVVEEVGGSIEFGKGQGWAVRGKREGGRGKTGGMGINAVGVFEEVGYAVAGGVGVRPGNRRVGKLRRAEDATLPVAEGDRLKGSGTEEEAQDSQGQSKKHPR